MEKYFVIAHTIASIDKTTGGPARSVTQLVNHLALADKNAQLTLRTARSEDPIILSFEASNAQLQFYKNKRLGGLKHFKKSVREKEPHLCHGHGVWQMPVKQMASFARAKQIPYIITPRGMLEPWSLTQGKLKKKLALKIYQTKDLKYASCIHATAKMEAENIRALGFKNPIAVIPNGINLNEFPDYTQPVEKKQKVLFLSRIHEKKGIEFLIRAWKELDMLITKDWEVEIVGNGDKSYIDGLKKLIVSLKLDHVITISEPVFGEEKLKKYQCASLFVLPTHSENFGIVVAEALASKTPVITTIGTPWEELKIYNCGHWIDIGTEPLRASLETMLSKSRSELQEMGENGRKLIEDKYSMEAVATQMLELYNWLLTKRFKPEFVEIL